MMLIGRLKRIALGLVMACAAIAGVGAAIAARRHAEPDATPEPDATQAAAGQPIAVPVTSAGPWIKGMVVDASGQPVAGARVTSLGALGPSRRDDRRRWDLRSRP